MSKFKANTTYTGSFICNSESKINITVIRRTAKTLWADVEDEGEKRLKIHSDCEGGEFVFPLGNNYSMAPRVNARKVA